MKKRTNNGQTQPNRICNDSPKGAQYGSPGLRPGFGIISKTSPEGAT